LHRQVVLEISEHTAIHDYGALIAAAHSLDGELRFAVDDAGAGYASFRHILELRPDLVKLDIGLVHRIDDDDVRQSLVAGIVYFAQKSGCRLVAEGVETEAERRTLQGLGVDLGQGYLLGRPDDAIAAATTTVRPAAGWSGPTQGRTVGRPARRAGTDRLPSPAVPGRRAT
jgi:EAL domain-containing protein (putative c-di-GMP-specific phosphodiesterase class I)